VQGKNLVLFPGMKKKKIYEMTIWFSFFVVLNFFSVPSRVWSSGRDSSPSLYVGGYKSSFNDTFLRESNVGLVVNTAKNLAAVLGPKYLKQLEV
jgi:hypothetical protein